MIPNLDHAATPCAPGWLQEAVANVVMEFAKRTSGAPDIATLAANNSRDAYRRVITAINGVAADGFVKIAADTRADALKKSGAAWRVFERLAPPSPSSDAFRSQLAALPAAHLDAAVAVLETEIRNTVRIANESMSERIAAADRSGSLSGLGGLGGALFRMVGAAANAEQHHASRMQGQINRIDEARAACLMCCVEFAGCAANHVATTAWGFIDEVVGAELAAAESIANGGAADGDTEGKECPMCAELVKERARVCRFCGHDFTA